MSGHRRRSARAYAPGLYAAVLLWFSAAAAVDEAAHPFLDGRTHKCHDGPCDLSPSFSPTSVRPQFCFIVSASAPGAPHTDPTCTSFDLIRVFWRMSLECNVISPSWNNCPIVAHNIQHNGTLVVRFSSTEEGDHIATHQSMYAHLGSLCFDVPPACDGLDKLCGGTHCHVKALSRGGCCSDMTFVTQPIETYMEDPDLTEDDYHGTNQWKKN